jgi:8-amino-7-oxononanoate synthase
MKNPLDQSTRHNLFARVSAREEKIKSSGGTLPYTPPTARKSAHAAHLDFKNLPGYEELRMERAFGQKFGMKTPYFRVHEARPGSRTIINGKEVINFASYDYLGMNNDPEVARAAHEAIDRYGISASGSRHVAGERPIHRELEQRLARHYGSEDCVVLVSGYATNLGVIGQLVGPNDLIVCDSFVHNSATMGGVFSGAARRTFPHNDLEALEQLLAGNRDKFERCLIVVEGLYGMDGDWPDLKRLIEIKTRYSAWLMVDEAHALGVVGGLGHGSFEACNVDPRGVDIWMGTLSKTLAGCGGYIAGAAELVDYIKCLVNVFVYSVGLAPVLAATSAKSLEILHREPERVARLQNNAAMFQAKAQAAGLTIIPRPVATAVTPVVIGDSMATVVLSHRLLDRGVNVMPVLYPAVPMKAARLRFFLNATHTEDDINRAIDITAEEVKKLPDLIRTMNIPSYA